MEYNAFGVIASLMHDEAGYRSINVQHGIISPVWAFDGVYFDDYLIWSEQTEKVLHQENYPNPAGLHVVGNPKWEVLAEAIQKETPSVLFQHLMAWKGSSPLIGVYTQAIKGYATARIKAQYVKVLLAYLQEKPDVKMLIKKHPLEQDSIAEDFVSASGMADRVQILSANEMPLWESLKAVDVVTSVFSATLLEALYLGKPTVAIDLENTIARQGIPTSEALTIVSRQEAIPFVLDLILDTPTQNYSELALKDLVPYFHQSYRQRIRHALLKPELVASTIHG